LSSHPKSNSDDRSLATLATIRAWAFVCSLLRRYVVRVQMNFRAPIGINHETAVSDFDDAHDARLTAADKRLLSFLAIAACAVALVTALRLTHGLTWPYADDHFRDLAHAQGALDGHPLQDPYYAGEWIWYNPLLAWVLAATSWATGFSPALVHVHAGPWLNLFGPIAFYLLAVRLGGPGAGLVSLILFLFVNGPSSYSRDHATYGPWLFAATFAQGLFYATVLALTRARHDQTDRSARVVGVLAGLTFLAHTGPAVLLAVLAVCVLRPRALLVCGIVAATVASPYLYSIVVHYGAHVRNPAPMAGGLWMTASRVTFPALITSNSFVIVCGLAGMLLLKDRLLKAWLAISLVVLAYGLWCDSVGQLPRFVPNYHFWRYASAAMTIYAGSALWWLLRRVSGRRVVAVTTIAAAVTLSAGYSTYANRPDSWGRLLAQRLDLRPIQLARVLRTRSTERAVILVENGPGLEIAATAGRKVVALDPLFSNPYVDLAPRAQAADAMFRSLDAGDSPAFRALARTYGVTHVVALQPRQCRDWDRPPLAVNYYDGDACLFAITGQ
jgi:hypothetical protein